MVIIEYVSFFCHVVIRLNGIWKITMEDEWDTQWVQNTKVDHVQAKELSLERVQVYTTVWTSHYMDSLPNTCCNFLHIK